MNGRHEHLWSMYLDEPGEPFNLYALALEYLKSDMQKSRDLFLKLIWEHPEYIPAYYMTAELLINLEEIPLARQIITDGMREAGKQNNTKALSELKNLKAQIDPDP